MKYQPLLLASVAFFILSIIIVAFSPVPPQHNLILYDQIFSFLFLFSLALFSAWIFNKIFTFFFKKAVLIPRLISLGAILACFLYLSIFLFANYFRKYDNTKA